MPASRTSSSYSRKSKRTEGSSRGRAAFGDPAVLRVPEWSGYSWLAHGFSTRMGGVSTAYRNGTAQSRRSIPGELNLGFTPADSRKNVLKNREIFLEALLSGHGFSGARLAAPARLVLLRQIHSGLVRGWSRKALECAAEAGTAPRGDGSVTGEPGWMLGIQTADCFPILVADVRQRIVAAFHAGWRGTLARIVEHGVGRMRAEFGSRPEDLTAAIGPGIGRCCYAVGDEVRMEFESQFAYAPSLFHEVFDSDPIRRKYPLLFLTARAPGHSDLGPGIHLDLQEANRRQLLDAGVPAGKIYAMGLCTSCNLDRFFSYRAEDGFTGRMLSAIGRLS